MQRTLQQSGRIQITPVSKSTARSAAEQRAQVEYFAAVLASFHQQRSALRYYTLGRAREQMGAATD